MLEECSVNNNAQKMLGYISVKKTFLELFSEHCGNEKNKRFQNILLVGFKFFTTTLYTTQHWRCYVKILQAPQ